MATEILADFIRNPETRIGRALRLLDEHGDEIEHVAPFVYLVPSSEGEYAYRVTYGGDVTERCSCEDFHYHGDVEPCKHLLALAVRAAKRRRSKVAA